MKTIARRGLARGESFQLLSLRDKFPRGLTFYKNYTNIPVGVYAGAAYAYLLNADFALGSPAATFTSTDGNFTITSSGYQATTANDEVLKYLIAGNRTAAQETIVIKFTVVGSSFTNDATYRVLTSTDTTHQRTIRKFNTAGDVRFYPNLTDSPGSVVLSSTKPILNSTYTVTAIAYGTASSPNIKLYVNGVSEADTGSSVDTDYTSPLWGTSFYIGCGIAGNVQADCIIKSVLFFNRALSDSEVLAINNLIS